MKKNVLNVYLALCCFYYLQGFLYPSGGILSRLLLTVIMAISIYFFLIATIHYKLSPTLKILTVMVLAWSIYGVFAILLGTGAESITPPYFYLKNILFSILPIFVFYLFASKGILTDKMLKYWFFVFFAVSITQYYQELQKTMLDNFRQEEVTNNAGYIMVSLLPILPLFKDKPILQYSLLAIIMYFVIIAYKRGAILAGFFCSVFIVFLSTNREKNNKKVMLQQLTRLFLVITILIVAYYFIQNLLLNSDYFNSRLDDTISGDSSARDSIYSRFYNIFINQDSPINFMFGNGAHATLRIGGGFAHNDWLEIAINNGLWMVILYAVYWWSILRMLLKGDRKLIADQMVYLFFFIYFFRAAISMSYSDIMPYASCAFGYGLANYQYKGSQKQML